MPHFGSCLARYWRPSAAWLHLRVPPPRGHTELWRRRFRHPILLSVILMENLERITVNPDICHGKPTIRGTRIMVTNVLSLLAGGYTTAQIREYYPELKDEDVRAAIEYAARLVDEEVVLTGRS